MTEQKIVVRVTPAMKRAIRSAAAIAGQSDSTWVRAQISRGLANPIEEPEEAQPDGVADHQEALAIISRAARGGDVGAMKLLLAATAPPKQPLRAVEEPPAATPSVLDELKTRRMRGR